MLAQVEGLLISLQTAYQTILYNIQVAKNGILILWRVMVEVTANLSTVKLEVGLSLAMFNRKTVCTLSRDPLSIRLHTIGLYYLSLITLDHKKQTLN